MGTATRKSTKTSTLMMTMIRAGSAARVTSTGPTGSKTRVLPGGAAARKPAGKIAGYLQAKPRNTAAIPTPMRGVLTTTIRTSKVKSSFGAQSLRFMVASTFRTDPRPPGVESSLFKNF